MSRTPPELTFALESVTAGAEAPRQRVRDLERTSRPWLRQSGVQGIGIGAKVTDGVDTGVLALRVYVDAKRPLAQIDHPVPKVVEDPAAPPVLTDVIAIGRLEAELFTGRSDPAVPGCGVGNALDNTAGTLGALVRDRSSGTVAILSNTHVLARDGLASPGEAIVQPGVADGGADPADHLGSLARFVPPQFSAAGYPNTVDAAIADIAPTRAAAPALRLLGHAPRGVTTNVRRGMHVHKVGRTSDLTTGIVLDVHFTMQFTLRRAPGDRARIGFRRQVLCTRFTDKGDSGALVLSSSGRAVGLHFAGSPSASVFNRIDNVLEALDVELVLEGGP